MDMKPLDFDKSGITMEERDIATNYMRGMMPAPVQGSEESYAMSIAMSILSDRLFEEIRTKRGLTYATFASYPTIILNHPYNFIYVSTVEPDSVVQVMIDLLREYRDKGFDEKKVKYKKGEFLTQYFMGQETNASQSMFLGNSAILGDWMLVENYLDKINAVSTEDVNAVFDKYITAIRWVYLGDVEKVTEDIFTQPI